jgi:hypothetical protein
VLLDTGMKGFYDLSNIYKIFKDKTEIELLHTGNGSASLGMFENTQTNTMYKVLPWNNNSWNKIYKCYLQQLLVISNSRVG